MATFTALSSHYRDKSLVHATEGEKLIDLLPISAASDILDVGCGTGNLTAKLRKKTKGRVIGMDPSAGMIRQARSFYPEEGIEFHVVAVDRMPFSNEFDIVFCNCVFHWFKEPLATLNLFRKALRSSGKVAMQVAATTEYCPNFISAIEYCRRSDDIDDLFSGFRLPWFLLETTDEYRELFERAGFTVPICYMDEVHRFYSPAQVFDIFNCGASVAYLNQEYFAAALPDGFADKVPAGVKESFNNQANEKGEVDLMFYRVYVIAEKG